MTFPLESSIRSIRYGSMSRPSFAIAPYAPARSIWWIPSVPSVSDGTANSPLWAGSNWRPSFWAISTTRPATR